MTDPNIDRLRADTPGCERLVHFNNAGASLMPRPVVEAVIGHLKAECDLGGYEAADVAKDRIEGIYRDLGLLLNCGADEIALAENATRAWDMAVYALGLGEGDRVLLHDSEYGSNLMAFVQLARSRGVIIDRAASTNDGAVDLDDLDRRVQSRTCLIAVTHISSHRGLVNPVVEIGQIARRHGLTYMLDAAQSVGQTPIDIAAIGCDLLAATGRKFLRGPRGTGFLYVRRALAKALEPPFVDLRAADWNTERGDYDLRPDARRFETWEASIAGRLGLGAAVRYAADLGVAAIQDRVIDLAATLRSGLEALPGIEVLERGPQRSAIVAFSSSRHAAPEFAARLRRLGANVSVAWPTAAPYAGETVSVVRASPHYFNTADEIERFLKLVAGA